MKTIITSLTAVAAALLLVACGGSGSSLAPSTNNPPPPPPPTRTTAEGAWTGKPSANKGIFLLVLDNDALWGVLATQPANGTDPTLLPFQGTIVQDQTAKTYTVSNGRVFGSGTYEPFTIADGHYIPGSSQSPTLAGTLNEGVTSTSTTFSADYRPNFDQTPLVATVVGTYTGPMATAAGQEDATVIVKSDGSVTATGNATGCGVSGQISQYKGGTHGNVYAVTLTENTANCTTPNLTATGVAYYDAPDGHGQLIVETLNSARTDGLFFVGGRQAVP